MKQTAFAAILIKACDDYLLSSQLQRESLFPYFKMGQTIFQGTRGLITPEKAKRLMMEDVVIGETWAQNEIERYTYRMPGQATAYFYGYSNLQALRTQVEVALGDKFDDQKYHDFLLAQGILPPQVLRTAVFEDFVPAQQ